MKYLCFVFLLYYSSLASAEINWIVYKGINLDTIQRNKILNLSHKLNISNIYEIKVGPVDHFDQSDGIVVKGVKSIKDSIQYEKWLYIWRTNHKNDGFLFRNYFDSSVVDTPFFTGKTSIRSTHRYIYKYNNQKNVFNMYGGKYQDVKFILDCIMNGIAVEDSSFFNRGEGMSKESKRICNEAWHKIKSNLLDFVNVTQSGNEYSFGYRILHSRNLEHEYDRIEAEAIDAAFKAIVSKDTCQIVFWGPQSGSK